MGTLAAERVISEASDTIDTCDFSAKYPMTHIVGSIVLLLLL